MATTASLVVNFGGDDSDILTAELDSDRNNSKTTFQAGESVYFKVYHTVPYTVSCSSGVASLVATDEVATITSEIVSFVKSAYASVDKFLNALLSYTWFDAGNGNNYGAITASGNTEVKAAAADKDSLGVATINYQTKYDVWKLTPPIGMSSVYAILVYIEG